MMRTLFGDVKNGQLLRLPYLGWSLLLGVIAVATGIGVAFVIFGAEQMVGGDLENAQAQLNQQFGMLTIIVLGIIYLFVIFVGFNLMAKRLRNMGLPGWWSVLAVVLIAGLISAFISEQIAGAFNLLVWLALLLVPAGMFSQTSSARS